MHVDFSTLGKALGIRPDAAKIVIGIPTRIQKLIRSADTFLDVTALSGEFAERSMFNGCGPAFEPEEKDEYDVRREELFLAYFDTFHTLEDFVMFGKSPAGNRITSEEENRRASLQISRLFYAEFEGIALDGKGAELEGLEPLLELYARLKKFRWAGLYEFPRNLAWKIRKTSIDMICTACDTKTVEETVAIFGILADRIDADEIFDRSNGRFPWASLWTKAQTIDDLLYIEQHLSKKFYNKEELEARFTKLVTEEVEKLDSYKERMAFARRFVERDLQRMDGVYPYALRLAAEKVETETDVLDAYHTWRGLGNDRDPRPAPPQIIFDTWDKLHLESARTEGDLKKLSALLDASPSGTNTWMVARDRLYAHFRSLLAQAQTNEEVDRVEEEAGSYSRNLIVYGHNRKDELREQAERKRVLERWNSVQSGTLPVEDEKRVLVGLFQDFRREPELRKAVLLRLARFFPAQEVVEVEVEVG